ncbi:MAG: hypothetical protein ACRCT2_07870 [Plesiomonas shigelloides]
MQKQVKNKMIKTIKLSLKTFSSFMLTVFTLSLCAECFFAHAETLFGPELSGTLGIHKLQAVLELVSHRSAACLFVMGMLRVFFFLLVLIGVVALGVVRFYVWTFVKSAVSSAMGSLRSFNVPSRRSGARFVASLIKSSLSFLKTVKDGSVTMIQGLWEAGCLKILVFVAAVVQTTTSRYQFAMKRARRFVLRVSFVFILLIELIGVVGALGGVSWLRFSAVGLLLVAAELGRSSAATKATLPARLDLVETSSCRHFDSNCPLGDSYDDGVALEGDFERSAKSNDPILDGSVSDEPAVSRRPSTVSDWRARFLALRAQNAALALAGAIPPTPSAPVKSKRTLQHPLPDPVELSWPEEPVDMDMDWEAAPPSPVRLNRKRCLEDSAAAVSSKRQRTLEYQIPIVEDVNETFAAACCDEQVDTGDSYTNNQPNNSSDPELTSKVDGDEDGCIGASGCEESNWQLLVVGFLPAISEEDEVDAELEEEEVSFIAAAEDAEELVAVVDEEDEEEPEKAVLDAAVLPRPRPTRKWKTFGPCNRTRPYLKRQCKENVRYTK